MNNGKIKINGEKLDLEKVLHNNNFHKNIMGDKWILVHNSSLFCDVIIWLYDLIFTYIITCECVFTKPHGKGEDKITCYSGQWSASHF